MGTYNLPWSLAVTVIAITFHIEMLVIQFPVWAEGGRYLTDPLTVWSERLWSQVDPGGI